MSFDSREQYDGWTHLERRTPFQGYRTYVALTYVTFNIVGFVVNLWVLYVVAPLLFAPAVKVPKSILFFIFALVIGDLTTMIDIQFWFNLIACITSYAVPLFGIVYWYVSVPFFLKNRAITTLVTSSSMDAALRKVITTVLLLTAIYVLCWSPYWVSMFAHNVFAMGKKSMIIVSYFIHLLPYVSCVAYPLIFTLLNRGIRSAHAKIVSSQRRRLKSVTDDASSHLRIAMRDMPYKAAFMVRSHIPSFICERKQNSECADSNLTEADELRDGIRKQKVIGKSSRSHPRSHCEESMSSSFENNHSETLL
ncbi:hypothetical protein DICVIV_04709 [Dictyocaulus viviparus]|uniref:G-protein coupled receptors family 1 profile domain-containing protein n=1 Tax=Dictyocaulus viviparus TaxID=29172 RepID=A0A0D8Y3I9_DICVI|nr:hypothetical protein DICVIV_04709 [Dictyocaulus viviparus]